MPEQRGKQATDDVKSEWTRAYQIYQRAPGDRYDKKKDRTSRIDLPDGAVLVELGIDGGQQIVRSR